MIEVCTNRDIRLLRGSALSADTVWLLLILLYCCCLNRIRTQLRLSSHLYSYLRTVAVGDCVEVNCVANGQEVQASSYGRVVEILSNELDDVKKAKVSWFYSKPELVELVGPKWAPFLSCLKTRKDEVYLSAQSELFSLECIARKAPHFPCLCLNCAEERTRQSGRRRKIFRMFFYRAVVDLVKGITSGQCEKCGRYSFCLEDREEAMTPAASTNTARAHNVPRSLARPLGRPKDASLQPRLCASARPARKFASLTLNTDAKGSSVAQCADILSTMAVEKTPCSKRRKRCTEDDVLASVAEKTPVKKIARSSARRKLDLDDSESEDPIFNIKDHADIDDPFEFNSGSEDDDKDFASPPLRRKTVTPSRQTRGLRPKGSRTPLACTPGRGRPGRKTSPLTLVKRTYSGHRVKNVTLSLPKRSIPEALGLDSYRLAQER